MKTRADQCSGGGTWARAVVTSHPVGWVGCQLLLEHSSALRHRHLSTVPAPAVQQAPGGSILLAAENKTEWIGLFKPVFGFYGS